MKGGCVVATGVPLDKKQIPRMSGEFSITYEGKTPEDDVLSSTKAELKKLFGTVEDQDSLQRNSLILGDNLGVLLSLMNDPTVRGKVRLIYIDPPFATKSKFQSRTQKDAYNDDLEGAHFIEFLRQRLILMREILAPDGSIYVHLDDNMAFPIKVIMDEVFGADNFRNWITRKKCNPKNYTRKQYGNVSDYILFYTKGSEYVWNRPYEPWSEESMLREYQYIEETTGRRFKKVPVHAPGVRNGATGGTWRGMNPPPGKHWQYTPERLDEMDRNGEIYWSPNGNPRRKVYFDQSEGIPIQDIWLDFKDAHNQNIKITGYPTEKNIDLLKRIIHASSNPGDLVLDAFCGSGTTMVAAEESERRWIGIDSSVEAINTVLNRLAHGVQPMGDFVKKKAKSALDAEESLFSTHVLKTLESPMNQNAPCFDLYCEVSHKLDDEKEAQWRSMYGGA